MYRQISIKKYDINYIIISYGYAFMQCLPLTLFFSYHLPSHIFLYSLHNIVLKYCITNFSSLFFFFFSGNYYGKSNAIKYINKKYLEKEHKHI